MKRHHNVNDGEINLRWRKIEKINNRRFSLFLPMRRAARRAYQVPIFWFVKRSPKLPKLPNPLKLVFPFQVLESNGHFEINWKQNNIILGFFFVHLWSAVSWLNCAASDNSCAAVLLKILPSNILLVQILQQKLWCIEVFIVNLRYFEVFWVSLIYFLVRWGIPGYQGVFITALAKHLVWYSRETELLVVDR